MMRRNQPRIAYTTGAGGRWLSYLFYCAENRLEFGHWRQQNFHQRPLCWSFWVCHHEQRAGAAHLFSGHCRFNIYLNSWLKFRTADNYHDFNSQSAAQQIFTLSNDAHWRNSADYAASYETAIDLDYALVLTDPQAFRTQLIQLVSQHPHWRAEWTEHATPEFVDTACAEFVRTVIDPAEHLNNVHSRGWQGWCHALALLHSVDIPVDIARDTLGYSAWLEEQADYFVNLTRPLIL